MIQAIASFRRVYLVLWLIFFSPILLIASSKYLEPSRGVWLSFHRLSTSALSLLHAQLRDPATTPPTIMDIDDILPLPSAEDECEPKTLVRAFSMELRAKCESKPDGGTSIEKALLRDFRTKEAGRQERIRRIEEYLESSRY